MAYEPLLPNSLFFCQRWMGPLGEDEILFLQSQCLWQSIQIWLVVVLGGRSQRLPCQSWIPGYHFWMTHQASPLILHVSCLLDIIIIIWMSGCHCKIHLLKGSLRSSQLLRHLSSGFFVFVVGSTIFPDVGIKILATLLMPTSFLYFHYSNTNFFFGFHYISWM